MTMQSHMQNAVMHRADLSEAWTIRQAFWKDRAAHEEQVRQALLSLEVAHQRHTGGVSNPDRRDPNTWTEKFALLTKPGMDRVQLELRFDYRTNVEAYPRWQASLRAYQPPALVVWGKHDPLFTVAGALAFAREVPEAEIHLVHAGDFALDEESMHIHSAEWSVMLLCLSMACAIGGGLYEHPVLTPLWGASPPSSFAMIQHSIMRVWSGLYFIHEMLVLQQVPLDSPPSKASRERPPLLYDRTALQRAVNARYAFPAARALDLAQVLYEQKVIT
jgi:hypothetical protein